MGEVGGLFSAGRAGDVRKQAAEREKQYMALDKALTPVPPPNPAAESAAYSQAALQGRIARRRAAGVGALGANIFTTPKGLGSSPTQKKGLLGL